MKTTLRIALTLAFCLALLLCLAPAGNCTEPAGNPNNVNAADGKLSFSKTADMSNLITSSDIGDFVYLLLPIDEAHFPDAVFRNLISERCDADGDSYLNSAEIAAVTQLEIRNPNIARINGIEYLTALTYLELHETAVTEADFHLNTALEVVHGSLNPALVSVTLGENRVLNLLHFPNSPISELDISGCPLILDAYLNGERNIGDAIESYISDKGDLLIKRGTKVLESSIIASGIWGEDLTWVLYNDGTLTISGRGEMADIRSEITPAFALIIYDDAWRAYKDDIKKVVIQSGVTSIGGYAFWDCVNITSLTVASSVTKIDPTAFSDCTGLLTAGPIGSGSSYEFGWETAIPDNAFYHCSGLKSAVIPNGVKSIGQSAFFQCTDLENVAIPSSVTSIGSWAFGYCCDLRSVILPSKIETIGEYTFRDCFRIEDIHIPLSLRSIGDNAFYGCGGLAEVYYEGTEDAWNGLLPAIGIGNDPLFNATIHYAGLHTVTYDINGGIGSAPESQAKTPGEALPLPDQSSAPYAFFTGWAEQPNAVEPDYPMPGGSYTRDQDITLYAVWVYPDLILPDAVTAIGEESFAGGAFRFPKLPEKEVFIGSRAFADCPNLKCIYIHDKITDISDDAFGNAKNIVILGGAPLQGEKTAAEIYAEKHGFRFVPVYWRLIINVPPTSIVIE